MDFLKFDVPMIMVFGFAFAMCVESGARALHPDRPFAYEVRAMPILYAAAIGFIALNFFMLVLPYFRAYPFADDWIFALPLKFTSLSEWWNWLFVQHVDHRIPIHKIVSFLTLRASGFDFRYMVGVNYALAIATSAMLLYVAKAYRGHLSAGDMLVPLGLLQFSAGYSLWAFQFQFISSIFFFASFIFCAVRGSMWIAALALVACALSGMNGLLFATIGAAAMLVWFAAVRRRGFVPFVLPLVASLIVWLTWKPTAASSTDGLNVHAVAVYLYGLLPASMGVFAFGDVEWKFAVVALLALAGAVVIVAKAVKRQLTLHDYLLAVGAICSFLVMASVAVGRSKTQGDWNPVTAMHYGSMSIFLPAFAWLIVSKRFPRAGNVLGIGLLAVFLYAFLSASEWRSNMIDGAYPHQQEIMSALKSTSDVDALAGKYLRDFTIDEAHKGDVTGGIRAFRAAGAALYGK
ncbi:MULTISPECIES: hypothetical protein [unclassified Caballeronia]|uniref:hypothetical protein n=1 Tax=unclassified Caballeronia TaxID=2646786 RepID=UPI001F3ACDBA|nr:MULTISPECIES: hypothetical protein [unclassified Caballeronia]MCE4544583.1 hypothetical protein [Caballeronia sp. PC1]MCE4571735.1 hypothetical protein [Caballeronia sp. CLC5]